MSQRRESLCPSQSPYTSLRTHPHTCSAHIHTLHKKTYEGLLTHTHTYTSTHFIRRLNLLTHPHTHANTFTHPHTCSAHSLQTTAKGVNSAEMSHGTHINKSKCETYEGLTSLWHVYRSILVYISLFRISTCTPFAVLCSQCAGHVCGCVRRLMKDCEGLTSLWHVHRSILVYISLFRISIHLSLFPAKGVNVCIDMRKRPSLFSAVNVLSMCVDV